MKVLTLAAKLTPHCFAAIFDSQLPSSKSSLKCPPKLPLPHKRGNFSSFKITPAVRVIARQLSVKNCLAAIFASRHQDASLGPLGKYHCYQQGYRLKQLLGNYPGQISAQGILHLQNPNSGPNSGKQLWGARIVHPNAWLEFIDPFFLQQKKRPDKFTGKKLTSQKSPSKIQPRNRANKILIAPLQAHSAEVDKCFQAI